MALGDELRRGATMTLSNGMLRNFNVSGGTLPIGLQLERRRAQKAARKMRGDEVVGQALRGQLDVTQQGASPAPMQLPGITVNAPRSTQDPPGIGDVALGQQLQDAIRSAGAVRGEFPPVVDPNRHRTDPQMARMMGEVLRGQLDQAGAGASRVGVEDFSGSRADAPSQRTAAPPPEATVEQSQRLQAVQGLEPVQPAGEGGPTPQLTSLAQDLRSVAEGPVEDDSLTPQGAAAPSEVGGLGGALKKFADSLEQPGMQKLLASLGMQITPTQDDPLGQAAIQMAESEAQRRFREALRQGAGPDAQISGLSAEGRQQILQDRAQRQELQSRQQARQDRVDIARDRLELQTFDRLLQMDQQEFDQGMDDKIFELRKQGQALEERIGNARIALMEAQTAAAEGGGVGGADLGQVLMRADRIGQVAGGRLEAMETRAADLQAERDRLIEDMAEAEGFSVNTPVGELGFGDDEAALTAAQERLLAVDRELAELEGTDDQPGMIDQLNSRVEQLYGTVNAMLGAQPPDTNQEGGGGQEVIQVQSEEEALQLPPGTRFRLPDGRTGTTR